MPTGRDIEAVLFDFGGVLSSSPFDAFERYERAQGLPEGFIRAINARNHHGNAWAQLERSEVDFDEFCDAFEAEAQAAGGIVDARALFATLSGELRPAMLEAVRRCHDRFKTGLLTNNFVTPLRESRHGDVLELFDVVIESAVTGVRKPDPRFYLLACEALHIEPPQAVFLDDLGVNLKPARELGMVTIKVTDAAQALSDLEDAIGIPLR
jgi:putative hydrolase of the HAD superfamily